MNLAGGALSVSDYFASYNAADGPFDENIELGSNTGDRVDGSDFVQCLPWDLIGRRVDDGGRDRNHRHG